MQISDKCGGAMPFAPLGTAGGGSSASNAAMNGETGQGMPRRQNRGSAWRLDPNVVGALDVRRQPGSARGRPSVEVGRLGSAPAAPLPAASRPAGGGALSGAGWTGGDASSSASLRALIDATSAEKKAALKARYDAYLREKDEQIAAISAEREAAHAEFESELAKIDTEAAAAIAFAS